ncbi:hypothetical protein A2U01_0077292, partial [Trifolium medium]|nr:hypothetical protein [Trifolium medium]
MKPNNLPKCEFSHAINPISGSSSAPPPSRITAMIPLIGEPK